MQWNVHCNDLDKIFDKNFRKYSVEDFSRKTSKYLQIFEAERIWFNYVAPQ